MRLTSLLRSDIISILVILAIGHIAILGRVYRKHVLTKVIKVIRAQARVEWGHDWQPVAQG